MDPKTTYRFKFTGTAVEIYAETATGSGVLLATVKDSNGKPVKMVMVDTSMKAGTAKYTDGTVVSQALTAKNVPVAVVEVPHGSYTLELKQVGDKTVSLDGFRVHNTMQGNTAAEALYAKAGEANPVYAELRDVVLETNAAATAQHRNVYKAPGISGVNLEEDSFYYDMTQSGLNETLQAVFNDLLNNGPKNELYLPQGKSLVFTIRNVSSKNVQVGLRSLSGTSATVTATGNGSTMNLNNTDMFYTVTPAESGKVTITAVGGPIAITQLKITDKK